MTHKTDIVVIGAGPVGLFTVFEAGTLKLRCHVVDSLEHIGGQCSALYPEKPIYDIPAHPKISGGDLIDNLEEQAKRFEPVYHLNQGVQKLEKIDDGYIVETSIGTRIECSAIVIAAGCGAFGPNRPPLAGLEEYEGKSVFYSVRAKKLFEDKNVVIAGGGDSAVDWVLSLSEIAKKVSLVHRRDKFRCAPDSADQIKKLAEEGVIDLVTPCQLHGLEGEEGNLRKVLVKDFSGNVKEIEADYLLPFYGLAMDLGPIAKWGLNLDKHQIEITDPTTMKTSEERIYAVGDVASYKNKLKLILSGFSEAASACYDINKVVNADEVFHFEYSTSKFN